MPTLDPTTSLRQFAAQDILKDGALPEYEQSMGAIAMQLTQLNTDLFIVDQILAFPFELFVGPDKMIFYRRVIDNFLDAALLAITRLAKDEGDQLLTIRRFKNRMRQLVREEHKAGFHALLKSLHFDEKTKGILGKARAIRNGLVAHMHEDWIKGVTEQDRIDVADLKYLRDILQDQLDALSFNTKYGLTPLPYDHRVTIAGSKPPTDIEQALDAVAKQSALINEPETLPAVWSIRRMELSAHQMQMFNYYRLKFGLPSA